MLNLVKIFFFTISLSFALTSCSKSPPQLDSKENKNTVVVLNNCTKNDFEEGSRWITGQLRAFKKTDPKYAYGFASEDFRSTLSISQFADIISTEYSMLLDWRNFEILSCEKNDEYFLFGVKVVSNEEIVYTLDYFLSKIGGSWGVDSANIVTQTGS